MGSIQFIVSICIRIPLFLFQYPKPSYRLVRVKSFVVIPTVEGDAPRFRVTSGVLPDGLRLDETTGEISGIPTTLGDPIDITIEVWNEVSSEKTTVTLVVKPLTILEIVLICVASIIVFCFMVLVVIRILLIRRDKHNIAMKTLERRQYKKI